MKLAFAFLLLLVPQEDVDALIRQLSDESIEVRTKATAALRALGERARTKLEQAASSGDTEVKTRASSILAFLDLERKERAWFPTPMRITLSGDMTLKEAVDAVEKQGGRKVACPSWPEGKVKIDLKDVPYWKAMEEIAKAGSRTLLCDKTGPTLAGTRHVAVPSVIDGTLRLHVARIADRRAVDFDKGGEDNSFSIFLSLGWEMARAPARLYVTVDEVQDDLGNDLTGWIRPHLRFTGHDVILASPENPVHASLLDLRGGVSFRPEAKRLVRIAGTITAFFRASEENLVVPMPKMTDEWHPAIEVRDAGGGATKAGESCVWVVKREGGDLTCLVKFREFDSRLVCTFGDLWKVKGEGGSEATGSSNASSDRNPWAPELWLSFRGAAGTVTAVQSLEINLPRRMIRKEIPFEFKDVPIR
jgi:hypothetical protein